ncbi:MAG: DUF192 domain-containing protein [Deltaproteobacteria bacterium]|jgi:uncharacterized protein|nr:DUF192 domain-containing protein [Deltaproteobacteria bacterium]
MKRIILLTAIAFLMFSCEKVDVNTEEAVDSKNEPEVAEEQPSTTVMTPGTVATIVVGDVPFSVEIAESDVERAKGLMNRESLPINNGMWFIFPAMGDEQFWMKNTLIPLDIIFIDDNMKVVHIAENAKPESTELIGSPSSFQYVLEINGGLSEVKGIEVGDVVEKRVGPK